MSTFREDGYAAVDWAAHYLDRVGELPVLAQVRPGELTAKLPPAPPEEGEPFGDILRDLDDLIVPALTNWQHPRFFAYFAVTGSEPGILAELLAATMNQVAILWRASPASTELELHVVDWVRQLLGLPDGWHGHIEDTASTSTLAALMAARHVTGRNVLVCSEHAHSAADKAARMLGMELRKVPADENLAMRTDVDLSDVAAVVATVGTTSFASVDPVRALAERAHAAGAWLHVDAAYAGSAWILEEERWSQDGVELADSLVINPHKWLLTPMDCSLLWTSKPEQFREAFSLTPEFLRTPDDAYALSDYGPALGRRFRSLKLWAVLRCYGAERLREIQREHIRLAQLFAGFVEDDASWELCAPQRFSLVAFRRIGTDEENEQILERVNRSGEIFISHTKLAGRYVLRLAIGNIRTTEADIRHAWKVPEPMIVTTMNDIPGYEVDEVFGEVMGLTVRSRNIGSQIGAGLKSILGGELKGMTKALVDSRLQVMDRMIQEAELKGANAIIAMRFDTSEMGGQWTEICAYGTAVKIHKS